MASGSASQAPDNFSNPPPPAQKCRVMPNLSTTVQCFSDGAWDNVTGRGGMGWIIKKQDGATLLQGSSQRRYVASVW